MMVVEVCFSRALRISNLSILFIRFYYTTCLSKGTSNVMVPAYRGSPIQYERATYSYIRQVVSGCNEGEREKDCGLPVTTKEMWTFPSAGAVRAMGKATL